MLKHTPGPWKVTRTGNDHNTIQGIKNGNAKTWVSAEGGMVAHVFPCANPRRAFNDPTLPDTTNDELEPIGQANASLIAAAPELLAALEAIVSMYERGYVQGVSSATGGAFLDSILSARAAITKAKRI